MKMMRGLLQAIAVVALLYNFPSYAADKADGAVECFKRAERYEKEANRYANDVRDPTKWFDLAMKNYLCAAQAGNALAMWRVVNLSGSGQVEALPKKVEDKYLHQAAEAGLADAQIAMGMDYCDNIVTNAPCKNPVEAEKWFLKAAKSGDADGAFALGNFYEDGLEGIGKVKALACYKLSLQRYQSAISIKGNEGIRELKSGMSRSKWGVERMLKVLGERDQQGKCY